jgi:predicted nuclease of predicted toxin-antitoxin system
MRFIVDAQLSPELAGWIRRRGHEASAVRDIGLRDADDGVIWAYAVSNAAVIVTKDKDFAARRQAVVAGPQILWLKLGNTLNGVLLARLSICWPEIEAVLIAGHSVVEVR